MITNSVIRTVPFCNTAIGHSTRRTRRHAAHDLIKRTHYLLLTLTTALIGACSAPSAAPPDWSRASSTPLSGRWDDLAGALAATQRAHEMALLTTSDPSDDVRVITLLTILDERVYVRAQRRPQKNNTPGADGTIDLSVSFGLWGDAEKEQAIIQTMERSLAAQRERRRNRQR